MTDDQELDRRLARMRDWSRAADAGDDGWQRLVPRLRAARRRARVARGGVAVAAALLVGGTALALTAGDDEGAVDTRIPTTTVPSPTTTGPPTTVPEPTGAAFAALGPGWHALDTGPVPPALAALTWTGTELVVAAPDTAHAYSPAAGTWRDLPAPPFDPGAVVAITATDDELLMVARSGVGSANETVTSASLAAGASAWVDRGPVPDAYATVAGTGGGPRDPNDRTALVWTGARVIDATHGAVYDPAAGDWTTLPVPDDLVSFTQLLYTNPVWDGHELVLAYPAAVEGLAYDATGSTFRVIDGLGDREAPVVVGPGFAVRMGDEVFTTRDDPGTTAVYSSRGDMWRELPPVPGVQSQNACPGHAASLGDTVLVASCYGEPPVWLVDGRWVPIESPADGGSCCAGQWLGVDGALVVWDSDTDTANNPEAPYVRARVWVPPGAAVEAGPGGEAPSLEPGWTRLPDAPISGRTGAAVAVVDDVVHVVGGWEFLCPPAADCILPDDPPLADGAALDPVTGAWTSIAPAPVGFHDASTAVVGGDLYVAVTCAVGPSCPSGPTVLRYRPATDEWTELGAPPVDERAGYGLVPFLDGLVLHSTSDEIVEAPDLRFDPATGEWTELPDDPLPAVYDRQVAEVDGRLFLFGTSREGLGTLAAAFEPETSTWADLPSAGGQGFQVWPADGRLYLNPHFGDATGGVFDPVTGTWSPFPAGPDGPVDEGWQGRVIGVRGADHAVYDGASGLVLDARTDEWIEVPARPGIDGATTFGESVTAAGARLVVFGGEQWTSAASGGRLLDELWIWTPPG